MSRPNEYPDLPDLSLADGLELTSFVHPTTLVILEHFHDAVDFGRHSFSVFECAVAGHVRVLLAWTLHELPHLELRGAHSVVTDAWTGCD